jgi:hypothetical protein
VLAWLALFLFALSANAESLHPRLAASVAERIQEIHRTPPAQLRNQAIEKWYQSHVQRQSFEDAAQIYAPEHAGRLKIAYASFTPERDDSPGADLGYGMHVVKRLELPLPGGLVKIIEVNEAWPEDKRGGGLLNPDEIRIKTLVFAGPSGEGSHRNFVFDSVRLAWGPGPSASGTGNELQIARRTRFVEGRPARMRVPVAAPGSCLQCHGGKAAKTFAAEFAVPGRTPDPASLVQPGFYDLPAEEMHGFREYVKHLRRTGRSEEKIRLITDALKQKFLATEVPELAAVLGENARTSNLQWLTDDYAQYGGATGAGLLDRHGYYERDGSIFVDATDDLFEGKYRWWEPRVRIPFGVTYGY